MAIRPHAPRQIIPARSDAIRIVPLHLPEGILAPAAAPQLTYRNGPLIASAEVFTMFWGAEWNSAPP